MRSLEGKCSRVVVFPVLSGDRRRCFESSAPPESKSLKSFEFKPLEKMAVFTQPNLMYGDPVFS